MNLDDKPALRWCLTGPWQFWQGGPDQSCEACPFQRGYCDKEGRDIPYRNIANDPSESYYRCDLLGKIVWGEYAPCTQADWQARARLELTVTPPQEPVE
jgi:hypothetical protein